MDAVNTRRKRRRVAIRRGMAPMEVVMTLGIVLPIAVVLYLLAQQTLGNLYHVVSNLVAYPYL